MNIKNKVDFVNIYVKVEHMKKKVGVGMEMV